jgi:uncharacterized protein (TIGR03435 family)
MVLDRTGLQGDYELSLKWASTAGNQDATGPSLFAAIQEQLGLKLEPAKVPVTMLVVDHVEKPSGN